MTWLHFWEVIKKTLFEDKRAWELKQALEGVKIKARFDFPLYGNKELYEIVSIDESGIVLRNPHCTRPVGHE